ncbi:MAG: hypothetical protein J1E43_02190 [Christensenellaceae bacterium]|nr:hypothetical protein [Christensenellaceae bacterium]
MIRLFDQHRVRQHKELEGFWTFLKDDGKEYSLPVPGCWEQHPELVNFRGKGTYIRHVHVSRSCHVRLEFKGVSHTADVYFDDAFVAHHYNAFTPFSGIVRDVQPGDHVIRVEVDNTFGEHSALHIPNDYYTYGGIIRPVVVEELERAYVKDVRFLPFLKDNRWFAKVTVCVENLGTASQSMTVLIRLAGTEIQSSVTVAAGAAEEIVWEQPYSQAESWSPKHPRLYLLETEMIDERGMVIDDLIERVGFREVGISGNRLLVNGEPVFLKGFNRHEDHGVYGSAIPPQLMAQDMDLLQEAGANAVRTSHYPNDERFLDLCDERGMLVWEENHARGFGLPHMKSPNFDQQCADCIDEMIAAHYNHPSIVIWGILNECASETAEGRTIYQRQYEQIKQLDNSRPTTSATCRHFSDICLDLPDIVSFNLYAGWYENMPTRERLCQELDWIASSGGAGKPVIVSEFGAGAIYGFRDRGHAKWSEERQADILRDNLESFRDDGRLTGVFIWQLADCRVSEEWFSSRPRCHNNKGLVDEFRRPKEAFDVVKELFPTMG